MGPAKLGRKLAAASLSGLSGCQATYMERAMQSNVFVVRTIPYMWMARTPEIELHFAHFKVGKRKCRALRAGLQAVLLLAWYMLMIIGRSKMRNKGEC